MAEQSQRGEPGASTSLLDRVVALALDEDYADAAARREAGSTAPRRPATWVAVVALGILLATAAAQTQRFAPAFAEERARLVAEINSRSQQLQTLRQRTVTLTGSVQEQQQRFADLSGRRLRAADDVTFLGAATGAEVVSGPGVQVVVDDAPTAATADARKQVLDVDLQVLVNGLWQAGAEAISVNGHRLTSLSAIRGAGQAITVDYSSLTRPYTIEAIGNSDTLPGRFLDSAGGQSWLDLRANLGLRFTMTPKDTLTLAGKPSLLTCCRDAEVPDR